MSKPPRIPQRGPFVQDTQPGRYAWCTCGESAKQPLCDGSHAGTDFVSHIVTLDKPLSVAWCGCKHTKNPPYCDGSHTRIPDPS